MERPKDGEPRRDEEPPGPAPSVAPFPFVPKFPSSLLFSFEFPGFFVFCSVYQGALTTRLDLDGRETIIFFRINRISGLFCLFYKGCSTDLDTDIYSSRHTQTLSLVLSTLLLSIHSFNSLPTIAVFRHLRLPDYYETQHGRSCELYRTLS